MESERKDVRREDMEGLWRSVAESATNPRAGIFGPDSISWKINRESALFLGAGRAALLQLAHPWVAAALDHHSNLRNDPLARFHNTFRIVFTMVFGTLDQALGASRSLYQMHTRIQGQLPQDVARYEQNSTYRANDIEALIWVFATLVESAVLAYEIVQPKLSSAELGSYYTESKTMAALFGIPPASLPADWVAFQRYVETMVNSDNLGVSELSRDLARRVLHGSGSWVPVPKWYRTLTAEWMPSRLREQFALPNAPSDPASTAKITKRIRRTYARFPTAIRYVGPYHDAQRRLEGRNPGLLIRASNRFWMGQPRLMFPELEGRNG
jgi:uncharacterized protein (DUF2236 family)